MNSLSRVDTQRSDVLKQNATSHKCIFERWREKGVLIQWWGQFRLLFLLNFGPQSFTNATEITVETYTDKQY